MQRPALAISTLIRAERCEKCRYSSALPNETVFECRQQPPSASVHPLQRSATAIDWQTFSTYPRVKPDQWCGQFKPHVDGVH